MSTDTILVLGQNTLTPKLLKTLRPFCSLVENHKLPPDDMSAFRLVISFGLKSIVAGETLESSAGRIINLHPSWLPFNRGRHPIFWAALLGNPFGVSIHLMDSGLDTGPVLVQKKVNLDVEKITFREAHQMLNLELLSLLEANIHSILENKVRPTPQSAGEPPKSGADLPTEFSGWDSVIGPEVRKLRRIEP